MTKIIKKQISHVAENHRGIFYMLVAMIVVVASLYGYLVKETIVNVVAREHAITESRNINSQIGDLESSYIAEKNKVTIDLAYEKGFKDVSDSDVNYISLRDQSKTLSYNARNF